MFSSPGEIEQIGSENQNNYMCTCPKPANSQVNSGVKRGRCSNRQTNEKTSSVPTVGPFFLKKKKKKVCAI